MGNTMYDYWKRQPEVLRRILDGRKTQTAEFAKLFCEVRPDKSLPTGGQRNLAECGERGRGLWKRFWIRTCGRCRRRTFRRCGAGGPWWRLSRRGLVHPNTLEAMEALKEHPAISITGEAQCEIAAAAIPLIGCGEGAGRPQDRGGYTASVLCMYVCALEAAPTAGRLGRKSMRRRSGCCIWPHSRWKRTSGAPRAGLSATGRTW